MCVWGENMRRERQGRLVEGPAGAGGKEGWGYRSPGCEVRLHRMPFLIQKAVKTLLGSNFVLTQQQGFLKSLSSCSLPSCLLPSFLAGDTPQSLTIPLDFPVAEPQRRTEFRGPSALAQVSSIKRKQLSGIELPGNPGQSPKPG